MLQTNYLTGENHTCFIYPAAIKFKSKGEVNDQ